VRANHNLNSRRQDEDRRATQWPASTPSWRPPCPRSPSRSPRSPAAATGPRTSCRAQLPLSPAHLQTDRPQRCSRRRSRSRRRNPPLLGRDTLRSGANAPAEHARVSAPRPTSPLMHERGCRRRRWDPWLPASLGTEVNHNHHHNHHTFANHDPSQPAMPGRSVAQASPPVCESPAHKRNRYDVMLPRWESHAQTAPPLASSAASPSPSARRRRRPAQRTEKGSPPLRVMRRLQSHADAAPVSEETATTAPQRAPRSSRASDPPPSTPKMALRPPPCRLPTPPSRPPTMAPMCSS
jgi:hypothetical protein